MTRSPEMAAPTRAAFPYHLPIQIRWGDFDMFAHLNNVTYYRYFETILVTFLRDKAGLDWLEHPVAPFVAENSCRFLKPVDQGAAAPFGGSILGTLRVDHMGTKSVRYGLGLFMEGDGTPVALGQWVHVFVERRGGRSAAIPEAIRACFVDHMAPEAAS